MITERLTEEEFNRLGAGAFSWWTLVNNKRVRYILLTKDGKLDWGRVHDSGGVKASPYPTIYDDEILVCFERGAKP